MDKLESKSLDLESKNIEEIKRLFPNVVTEGKIDFDKLRLLLGDEVDDSMEKYQFTWKGKSQSIKLAQSPSTATLRPAKEESKNWDTTENLYIEGDNLEVLKQLQKTYFGKIKMIYIDPPYNTGGDFVYKDDFKDSIKNYKEQTNQTRKSNPETSGRYHTDWLNMMYPRLMLAKNLLSEDGAIFISIDDNESHNLRTICDTVFGETNRLSSHHIQVRYDNKSLNEKKDFQELIEKVLIYAKNKQKITINKPFEKYNINKFNVEIIEGEPEKEIILGGKKVTIFKPGNFKVMKHQSGGLNYLKETWASGSVVKVNASGKYFEKNIKPRKNIDGLNVLYKVDGIGEDGLGYRYFIGPKKISSSQGVFFSGVPLKRVEEIENGNAKKYKPIINFYDFSADFGNIRHEGNITFNSGKKPVKMLSQFINYIEDPNIIILDFFSGSSSTAHAVMKVNSEDGGNRKFIMVQLPEKLLESDEYYNQGFRSICDLGKERIRRAGEQIKQELIEKKQKAGMLSEDIVDPDKLDIGFKVFKLDETNIKPWDSSQEVNENTLLSQIEIIKPDRTKEDVLYEILLKYGVFNESVKEIKLNGNTAYSVSDNFMIVYLSENISKEDIKAIANRKPTVVVFLENGFTDDNQKINAEATLKHQGVEDVKCI